NETFATVEQLVSPPTIHFAPGYREGEEIVAYGTAGSSGSSGQQPQNEEYYVIGVEFKHREDDDGGPTVLWLCPYCPDRFTLYFYYRSHLKDLHYGKPFIGNPAEEAFIDARKGFNEKSMKRAYGDTWECTLCNRRGDRWYIMDHDCPHFMAAVARPSHSPQLLPLPLQQQERLQAQPMAPAPAGYHHLSPSDLDPGAIGAAAGKAGGGAGSAAPGQPWPRENSRDLAGASPRSA